MNRNESRGARDSRLCYLCGRSIAPADQSNKDHVPPQRFFGRKLRKALGPRLNTLRTHRACNSAYREDEEYFVLALISYAHDSMAGLAVMEDLKRGLQDGHARGLYDSIKRGFSVVVAADGRSLFQYDKERIDRIVWKIIRGMYFVHVRRVLPVWQPFECILVPPTEAAEKLPTVEWFSLLMETKSICDYGAVFDMRAVGGIDANLRVHFQALLFWDRIIALVRFHDPSCTCDECQAAAAAPESQAAGEP